MFARVRRKKWTVKIVLAASILFCYKGVIFPEPLTPAEAEEGWLRLFDGTLTGWNASGNWQAKDDVLASDLADTRSIFTAYPFTDFLLKFDYRITATPSGATLRLRASHDGQPSESGYRVPLSDSVKDWPAGSIIKRAAAQPSSIALNTWHSVTVEANGNHIRIEIDGRSTADIHDDSARAGYIGFESVRGAGLDLRNLRAKPLNVKQIFDGADLSGWKNIPYQHQAGKGLFHVFSGSSKPHSAEWSVKAGAIHGEKGPGAIESENQYDNFILQFKSAADIDPNKKDAYPALSIRNQAGSIGTGYPLGLGRHAGEIGAMAKPRKPADNNSGGVLETVIASGRSIYIFLNGALTTVYHDTRPEAATLKQGARTGNGVISLDIPDDAKSVDIKSIAAVAIPQNLGGIVKEEPSVASSAPVKGQSTAPSSDNNTTQAAQLAAALGMPTPQARSRSADLISKAVKSNDPQEQMDLYGQVIKIDPTNAAAIQGYKEAQQKLLQQQAQQQQQQQQQQVETQKENETEQQLHSSLAAAQASFLGGHIREADRSLQIAERLAPSNPVVNDLRRRINAALGLRQRLLFAGSAAGVAALFGGSVFFFRRRRLGRHPVLEVVQGLDQGRKYPLDRDVVRIGAIVQDGSQKNDIVVRDIEHMISRFHCEIVKKNGHLLLKDMNSSNGTKVDGKPVSPGTLVPLSRRSRIDLGSTVVLRLGFERKKA